MTKVRCGWMARRWARLRGPLPYLLAMLPSAGVSFLVGLGLLVGCASVPVGAGLVLVPLLLTGLRLWTDVHRSCAARVLGEPVPARFRPLPGSVGGWWRQVLGDRTTGRDLLWIPLHCLVGGLAGLLAWLVVAVPLVATGSVLLWWLLPSGDPIQLVPGRPMVNWADALLTGVPVAVAGAAVAALVVPPLALGWARLTRAVLDRSGLEQLRERVGELTESRAGALDAHSAELRRIERDLHDGTQARLVSIALRLGIARQTMRTEPEVAAAMIGQASEATDAAMGELRSVLRTMYPPVLADRGLVGALRSLLAGFPPEVESDLGDVGTPPAAVEAAAYFVVSEAVLNAVKHSGAARVSVTLRRRGDRLTIAVRDDGRGGADESRGSGISGIRRRVAALDGTAEISSPPSGPTVVAVELPCAR